MTIKKDILTVNVTKNGMKEVRGIVLHSMSGFYNGTISWFKNPQAQASADYIISKNGDILQMVEHTDMAWHAGVFDAGKCPEWAYPNPNFYTIGIELEDEINAQWQYPEKQRQALRDLLAMLMPLYKIPRDRILLHKNLNPSRRSDPVGAFSFDWVFPSGGGSQVNDNYYKGYDLTNKASMKVAVDILVRVQNGEFVEKSQINIDQTKQINDLKAKIENAKIASNNVVKALA